MSKRSLAIAAAGVGGGVDPNFKNVSLLLTGDGTNGAQNNTFLDSSTNNFTITRNGNTTQGTFSPYGNLWSNYFLSSGSGRLETATNFTALTGDFTIEFWWFGGAQSAQYPCQVGTLDAFSQTGAWRVTTYDNNANNFAFIDGITYYSFSTANNYNDNKWHHIAVTRSGTTVRGFVDGSQVGSSATVSTSFTARKLIVGGQYRDNGFINGYISNLRIVSGTALYTSNFTPSTTPLTAVSGTSLLTCQSNRFKDNSGNNFTLTVNGEASVQRFSPFNPTAPYSASTIGGSGYFDGTGDYLQLPQSGDTLKPLGKDFTIECWFYIPTNATVPSFSVITGAYTGDWSVQWLIVFEGGNLKGSVYWGPGSYIYMNTNKTVAQLKGQWNHVALTRIGSLISVYVNGESLVSTTSSTPLTNSTVPIAIGSDTNNIYGYSFPGYVSDFRMVIGSCVYTTNFTPSTTPLTAITNTSLLLNFTNAGIPDAAMMNDLETVGNAQVSTSVKKYGTGSLYFDGTGDYLKCTAVPIGSGDFTIEFWMYTGTSGTGTYADRIIRYGPNNATGNLQILLDSTHLRVDFGASVVITGSANVVTSSWNHIALTRSGTSVKLFVNGTQDGSTATSSSDISQTALEIAYDSSLGSASEYTGYIDDLRITKGLARYTANFTPPTQSLPTQ